MIWGAMEWGYGREMAVLRAKLSGYEGQLRRAMPCEATSLRQAAHDAIALAQQVHGLLAVVSAEAAKPSHRAVALVWGEFLPLTQRLQFERDVRVRAKMLRNSLLACLPIGERDEQAIKAYDAAEPTLESLRLIAQDLERLARSSELLK